MHRLFRFCEFFANVTRPVFCISFLAISVNFNDRGYNPVAQRGKWQTVCLALLCGWSSSSLRLVQTKEG